MIKTLSIILGCVFETYIIDSFIRIFTPILRVDKRIYFLSLIPITVLNCLSSLCLNGPIMTISNMLLVYCINLFFVSRQYKKIIFTSVITTINVASELLVAGMIMLFSGKDFVTIDSTPYNVALGVSTSKFFVFIIILLLKIGKKDFDITSISRKYLLVLSIQPITTLVLSILMFKTLYVIEDATIKVTFVFASMLLVLSNIVTFEVVVKQNELSQSKIELELLKENITEQTRHFSELQASQFEIKRIRHDMKNSYIGAIAEIEAGNINAAVEHMKNDLNIINETRRSINSGHPAIDTILERKCNYCEENGIKTDLSCFYNSDININEIELAIVIGNLFDNAIEANERVSTERYIKFLISVDDNEINITVTNPQPIKNPDLKTTKADSDNHGYGIKSIEAIAKKYDGTAKFVQEEYIFNSYVNIKNSF